MKNRKAKFMLVVIPSAVVGQQIRGAKKMRVNLMAQNRAAADNFVIKHPEVSILKKVPHKGWIVVSAGTAQEIKVIKKPETGTFEVRTAAGRLVGKFDNFGEADHCRNKGKTRRLVQIV